jgi:hypothetical protein
LEEQWQQLPKEMQGRGAFYKKGERDEYKRTVSKAARKVAIINENMESQKEAGFLSVGFKVSRCSSACAARIDVLFDFSIVVAGKFDYGRYATVTNFVYLR